MGFYEAMAATARRLLTSKGQDASLVMHHGGTFDPITQEETDSETATSCKAAILPLSAKDIEFWGGNSMVLDRTEQALVSAEAWPRDPQPGDTLTVGGVPYVIHGVRRLSPAGTAVLWTFLVGD